MRFPIRGAAMALFCLSAAAPAGAADTITRVPVPNFPISKAVKVPPGATMVYLSGMLAPVAHPDAPKGSIAAYGDTAEQAKGIFEEIKATLQDQGMTLGDVIAMHVYLAGDPAKDGKMDFAGLQSAYTQYFGTAEQPKEPVRAAMQVAALAAPWALVEIEVTAAKLP